MAWVEKMIVSDTNWRPDLSGAGRSKYKALAQAIRDGIASGALLAGTKLPPVRELAYQVGVTPGTVARAYALLTDEGRLTAAVGRGTFVAGTLRKDQPVETPLIFQVDEQTADFRSSRVPDVGQGVLIDAAFVRLGQRHRRRHINYPTAETDLEAREAVVGWLGHDRLGQFDASDVVLGNGAQNCCILALQSVLHGAHPVILTEELAYPGVRHAARMLRAEVVGLPMDDEGIIPDALAAAYRKHGGQVLLTAAEVHSPTTIKTSLARKQEIAALAESYGLTIIEDDCHSVAPSEVPCYRAILPKQSYFVSSLTKGVSGALRFGFIVAPVDQGRALRQIAQSSFYGVAQPILDVCTDLITRGDAAKVRELVIAKTAHRVRLAVNALGSWDIRWREDAPFVWVSMPKGWRASSFVIACERKGITIRGVDEFVLADGRSPNAVRLGVNTCVDEARYLRALDDMNDLLQHPRDLIDG